MKLTTTALVAIMLAMSAPAHAGPWDSFKNWTVRSFHSITGSKPTAYDKVYNSAYAKDSKQTQKTNRGLSSNRSNGCYSCSIGLSEPTYK